MSEQLTIGELFAGYGGLGMAVEAAFDARLSWYAEFEDAPSKILAHHYPDLTNYGDVTAVDWATVPPVDIISGGSPCQDVSLAGRRAGMTEGTRSNLWGAMRTAIETIRPKYVVWENVRGALSARAASASDMEPREGLLGEGPGDNLRALGRVLGDLADLGYDAQWCGLRASDVGAPHQRFRVFILATRADVQDALRSRSGWRSTQPGSTGSDDATLGSGSRGSRAGSATADAEDDRLPRLLAGGRATEQPWAEGGGGPTADAEQLRRVEGRQSAPGEATGGRPPAISGGRDRAPTPDADGAGLVGFGRIERAQRDPDGRDRADAHGDHAELQARHTDWGPYAPAIHRWEQLRGPAPAPTELTVRGKHRLSPLFVEWMMGLPAGHVTSIDISRNEQLKALGNGVVPQQAAAALSHMLSDGKEANAA